MAENAEVKAQLDRYANEPIKKSTGEPTWTLNSRNLIAACLYGPMGAPIPRGFKDKLPSTAAGYLEKMAHPFAGILMEYRSKSNTASSLTSALQHVFPASDFIHPLPQDYPEHRARIVYNVVNFNDVERIFTKKGGSIPISADKRVRYALKVNTWGSTPFDGVDPANRALLPEEELIELAQGEDVL